MEGRSARLSMATASAPKNRMMLSVILLNFAGQSRLYLRRWIRQTTAVAFARSLPVENTQLACDVTSRNHFLTAQEEKLVTNSSPKPGDFWSFSPAAGSGEAKQAKGCSVVTSQFTRTAKARARTILRTWAGPGKNQASHSHESETFHWRTNSALSCWGFP